MQLFFSGQAGRGRESGRQGGVHHGEVQGDQDDRRLRRPLPRGTALLRDQPRRGVIATSDGK